MFIYQLKFTGEYKNDYEYDEIREAVVAANSEEVARKLMDACCSGNRTNWWLDPVKVDCKKIGLSNNKKERIILSEAHEG